MADFVPNSDVTNESIFITSRLTGHKKSVSCITVNPADNNNLISGSDDRTVRMWDVRNTTNKSTKCIAGCFNSGIESMTFVNEHFLCVASGTSLFSFDVRFDGVLQRTPLSSVVDSFEEINQIVSHPKDSLIAVADDSGAVTTVPVSSTGVLSDNSSFSRYKKLSRVHTNIVGSVAFRRPNPSELTSGGFDSVWDVARGRPTASVRLEHLADESPEGESSCTNQILNPPFVQALEYVCGGRGVVFALGDGSVSC